MNPYIFEAIMLLCFGLAWPFSIYKMVKSKKAGGKSIPFLLIILAGYISGIFFKYFAGLNAVIYLYLFNTCMVSLDLALTIKYSRNTHQTAGLHKKDQDLAYE